MKLYKYFIIPEKDEKDQQYELYAFTNKKILKETFEIQRNMKKFIGTTIDIDREDYIEFANSNRNQLLESHSFETAVTDKNNNITVGSVEVVTTYYEYISVIDDELYFFDSIDWSIIPKIKVFRKDIRKALHLLEFEFFRKMYGNTPGIDGDDDYSAPNIAMDQLGLMLYVYNKTFK